MVATSLIATTNLYLAMTLLIVSTRETAGNGEELKQSQLLEFSNGPAIITNAGWTNGMGNNSSSLVEHESFWGIDYGTDAGRWTARDGAIYQSTALVDQNVGSRAYPIYLATGAPTWLVKNCDPNACECSNTVAPGVAYTGCWQIDMSIGSSGCRSFL